MSKLLKYGDVWEAVVAERERQRVSYEDLSRQTGIPTVSIVGYFHGRNTPPYPRVAALAHALGIDMTASVPSEQLVGAVA